MHGRDLRQESLGVRICFRSSSRIVSRISSRQMKRMREVQPDETPTSDISQDPNFRKKGAYDAEK